MTEDNKTDPGAASQDPAASAQAAQTSGGTASALDPAAKPEKTKKAAKAAPAPQPKEGEIVSERPTPTDNQCVVELLDDDRTTVSFALLPADQFKARRIFAGGQFYDHVQESESGAWQYVHSK